MKLSAAGLDNGLSLLHVERVAPETLAKVLFGDPQGRRALCVCGVADEERVGDRV